MTNDQLEALAERSKLPVDVLRVALTAMYNLHYRDMPLPPGMKAVDFRKVAPGDKFINAVTFTENTAEGAFIPLHDPRIILEPNVLEVEVVSFEPVVEGGKHAFRTLKDCSEYGAVDKNPNGFFQGPTTYSGSWVYRKVVTKKSIPIT